MEQREYLRAELGVSVDQEGDIKGQVDKDRLILGESGTFSCS